MITTKMEKLNFTERLHTLKTTPKKVVRTSERAEILKEFLTILNANIKPPYKPMTPGRLGMMLAPVKTKDLYTFLAECKYAKNFNSYFWWRFKQGK